MKFLSYDSKFGQLLIKLCYSCCLNILWFLCCLPVFTAGAATTALYYVCLKVARDEETSIFTMFFRAFKQNFKQATVLWLAMLAGGAVLGLDGWILWHLRAATTGAAAVVWTLLLAVIIAAAVVYVITLIFLFPLVASVSNSNLAMLKNAFFIGARYLFCTIFVFAVHFAMFFAVVRIFTPLIIFGEGLCAMLCAPYLGKVIRLCSYDPDAEPTEDER